jgi:hypothetical protein
MSGAIGGLIKPLLDPVLDSIGLGALKPLVHAAFDFASGNYMGLVGDLGEMINSFSGQGMNNVAKQPPIANAFGGDQGQANGVNEGAADQNVGQNGAAQGNRPAFQGPPVNRLNELLQQLMKLFGGQGQGGGQGGQGGIGDLFGALSKLFRLLAQMGQGQDQIFAGRQNAQMGQIMA